MSGLKLLSISPSENEFISEETLVTITSGIDHDAFSFVSGEFGPLRAGFPAEVPLWLAMTLRRKKKCAIQVPEWLSVAYLSDIIQREKFGESLEPVPFHYVEIAVQFLQNAREDVPNADEIAVLLQDLENIRMDRLRSGMLFLSQQTREGSKLYAVNLPNISAAELAATKKLTISSLGLFSQLISKPSDDSFGARRPAGMRPSTLRQLRQESATARAVQQQQQQSLERQDNAPIVSAFEDLGDAVQEDAGEDEPSSRKLRRFRS